MTEDSNNRVKFLCMRHGETTANAEGWYAGGSFDVGLTERGMKQAVKAGDDVAAMEPLPDFMISSGMTRTNVTASIVAERTGLQVKYVQELLKEMIFGNLAGLPKLDSAKAICAKINDESAVINMSDTAKKVCQEFNIENIDKATAAKILDTIIAREGTGDWQGETLTDFNARVLEGACLAVSQEIDRISLLVAHKFTCSSLQRSFIGEDNPHFNNGEIMFFDISREHFDNVCAPYISGQNADEAGSEL